MSLLRHKNIEALPILRPKIHFSDLVRRRIMKGDVSCIAIAWPAFIQKMVLDGVNELPRYHLLSIEEKTKDVYYLVPLDLADPFVMAVHLAVSMEIPIRFVDADLRFSIDEYWIHTDDYPVARLGIERYYEVFLKNRHGGPETREEDERAAKYMAHSLAELSKEHENVLFICEIFHWEQIRKSLEASPETTLSLPNKPAGEGKRLNLFQVYKNSIKWASVEIPYVLSLFVEHVKRDDPAPFDKWEALRRLLAETRTRHKENLYSGEAKNFEAYLFKICELEGKSFPDLWDLLRASHQILGEEWTTHLYRLACRYFHQDHDGPHEIIEFNSHFMGDGSEWNSAWKELHIDARPYRPLTRQALRPKRRRAPVIRQLHKEDEKPYRDWIEALARWVAKNGAPKKRTKSVVIIFEDKDRYHFPFRGLDPARTPEEGHLLFFATSPEMEQAFPESEVLSFGAVALAFGGAPPRNPFLDAGEAFAQKSYQVSEGEKLVLALAEHQREAFQGNAYSPILVVAALPPSENVLAELNAMGQRLFYFPIQRVP
ncbi:MAG: hypothetical protein JNM63_19445, partial [Spirochaetia bacterium]|nr:hypothetical protein [Spirochaetia bacterium]